MKNLHAASFDIFPTRFWVVPVGDLDADSLASIETRYENRTVSNHGGRQYECNWDDLPQLKSTLMPIADVVLKSTHLGNAWVNFNGPGDFNVSHHHPRSAFSGVYWHRVPEGSASLVFERADSYNVMHISSGLEDEAWSPEWTVPAQEGHCILFPAWLRHRVPEGTNTTDRISVAFNILKTES